MCSEWAERAASLDARLRAAGDEAPVFVAFDERFRTAAAPAVRIVHAGVDDVPGDGPPAATLRVDDYELLRIVFGRRRASQVAGQDWQGDPGPSLEHLHLFDLPATDLVD